MAVSRLCIAEESKGGGFWLWFRGLMVDSEGHGGAVVALLLGIKTVSLGLNLRSLIAYYTLIITPLLNSNGFPRYAKKM